MKLGIFVAALAMVGMASAQVDPNRTVIVINGEEIKGAEYYHRMEFLDNVGTNLGGSFQALPPGLLVLQRLIEERLLLQLAREKGVAPTDAEVQSLIDEREAENPGYVKQWTDAGISMDDVRYRHRLELAEFKLITQGVTITDFEIETHYNTYTSRFTVPKTFDLRMVAVAEGDKAKVDAELAAGKDFAEVARTMSLDPSKVNGGAVGKVPVSSFTDLVRGALDRIQPGQATEWLEGERAWVKFFLIGIEEEYVVPLDDRLKRNLRRELSVNRGRNLNKLDEMMRQMRAKANIELRQEAFKQPISQLLEGFKRRGSGS